MSKPHTCPVCGGRGTVIGPTDGEYNDRIGEEHNDRTAGESYGRKICPACGGKGIVWEPETPDLTKPKWIWIEYGPPIRLEPVDPHRPPNT